MKRWREAGKTVGWMVPFLIICAPLFASGQGTNPIRAAAIDEEQKLHPTLALGAQAPDFSLPGVDGKLHTLVEYKASPILAIVFTCNHCPTAQMYETRIKKLVEGYSPKGVAFVAIEPNDPAAASLRELDYTDVPDTMGGMIIRSSYRHFNFPYLYDGATQSVAQAYGPKNTPHIFVFDRERKLRYEGRIDDNTRESLVKTHDARAALDDLLANRPVAVPHTPVFGCSTKWKDEIEMKQRELARIEAEPVKLEMATTDDLKKLRSNPTGHVMMVAFWATWCGPCVEEFHDLETTYRWYRTRPFDLVTVSVNKPDEAPAVLKVLQQEHATSRNLLFASADTYAMQAAFDPTWDSGVPFTIVLAPDGSVIYKESGEVHLLALRRAILANLPDKDYVGHAAYWGSR